VATSPKSPSAIPTTDRGGGSRREQGRDDVSGDRDLIDDAELRSWLANRGIDTVTLATHARRLRQRREGSGPVTTQRQARGGSPCRYR
jgi:hypothetical protein